MSHFPQPLKLIPKLPTNLKPAARKHQHLRQQIVKNTLSKLFYIQIGPKFACKPVLATVYHLSLLHSQFQL